MTLKLNVATAAAKQRVPKSGTKGSETGESSIKRLKNDFYFRRLKLH